MAAVTNGPFRALCIRAARRGLPPQLRAIGADLPVGHARAVEGLYVNEMLTARALLEGSPRSRAMLLSPPEQKIRSLQLYGNIPQILAAATTRLIEMDVVDHIDLNYGCPVPKVTRKGAGSALPWKTEYFASTVRAVVKAAEKAARGRGKDIPVTVKIRTGIDDEHLTYLDAACAAQNAGAQAITLHARTTSQYYAGRADWSHIARLVEAVRVPVLGNGDVFSGQDALDMVQSTGCAAVEVGRGAQGRPWLFGEIAAALWGQDYVAAPTLAQICQLILEHAQALSEHFNSEDIALKDLRKHLGWYLRGFRVPSELKVQIFSVRTMGELSALLAQLDQDQDYPAAARGRHGRSGVQHKVRLPYGWLDNRQIDAEAAKALHLAEQLDEKLLTGGG